MRKRIQKFLDYTFIAIFLCLIAYWNTPYYQRAGWWKQESGLGSGGIIDKHRLTEWPKIKTTRGHAYVVFCLYDELYIYSSYDNKSGFGTYYNKACD